MWVAKKLERAFKKRHGYFLILLLERRWRIERNIANFIELYKKNRMNQQIHEWKYIYIWFLFNKKKF